MTLARATAHVAAWVRAKVRAGELRHEFLVGWARAAQA
jgi:hypothetical protein